MAFLFNLDTTFFANLSKKYIISYCYVAYSISTYDSTVPHAGKTSGTEQDSSDDSLATTKLVTEISLNSA